MNPAPRHIPATLDDLTGWCGPVIYDDGSYRTEAAVLLSVVDGKASIVSALASGMCPIGHIFLDVANDSVRDHLIRRYNLPDWHRDTPGGLSAEVSAGLVLGSVLRVRAGMRYVLGMYKRVLSRQQPGDFEMYQMRTALPFAALPELPVSECMVWHGGDGRRKQLADLLAEGAAFLSDDGLLLPPLTPGGEPVLWSTP